MRIFFNGTFFLPFSDTPASASFISQCRGTEFLASPAFRLVKTGFLAVKKFFYSIFRYSCHCQLYFLVQWKRIFETNPSFRIVETTFFPICQILLVVKAFISVQCKHIFHQILHFGQWKLTFGLVETNLFQFLR